MTLSQSIRTPPTVVTADTSPLLTLDQTAALLTICRRTLERRIAAKEFPPPLKIGRSSRYHPDDIAAILEKLARQRGHRIGRS